MPESFDLTIYSLIDGVITSVVVQAYPTASPHLAVHRSDATHLVDPPVCELWSVTHRVTGLAAITNAPSSGLALMFANRIAKFRSCDWSKVMPAKRPPKAIARAERDFDSILNQMAKIYTDLSDAEVLK